MSAHTPKKKDLRKDSRKVPCALCGTVMPARDINRHVLISHPAKEPGAKDYPSTPDYHS